LLAHGVEDQRQPRVARARPPHGQREAAAGAQHAPQLTGRALRLDREHQTLAAEHDVIGVVGLVDGLEVERPRLHVVQAVRAGRADRGHLRGDIGEHDLARGPDELRGRDPDAARAAGQLEHALARRGRGQREQPGRELRAARVDVVGVLAPAVRDACPQAVDVGADVFLHDHGDLRAIRYSMSEMK
jgi:hypothetical protein